MSGERILRLRITGFVQGVGYRAFVQAEAERLGLSGWVRNRRDRSVEAVAAGPAEAVGELLIAPRRGPPGGRVEGVDLEGPTPRPWPWQARLVRFLWFSPLSDPQPALHQPQGAGMHPPFAPVAQLDRAPDYESGGQEFESLRARHCFRRLVGRDLSHFSGALGARALLELRLEQVAEQQPASAGDQQRAEA